ncbi:hypothetical protein Bbelb_351430 [Branchiostoma belcheri]|nr:hypothetical protein Bbelb_351430 [Branchiostoma belcheri]
MTVPGAVMRLTCQWGPLAVHTSYRVERTAIIEKRSRVVCSGKCKAVCVRVFPFLASPAAFIASLSPPTPCRRRHASHVSVGASSSSRALTSLKRIDNIRQMDRVAATSGDL